MASINVSKMVVGTIVALAGGAIIGAVSDNFGAGLLSALFIGGGFVLGDKMNNGVAIITR